MANLYVVAATGLNLRSAPVVAPSTKLVTLPEGELVTKIGDAGDGSWWQVSAQVDGVTFTGFVKWQYLTAVASPLPAPTVVPAVPPVHLTPKSAIRRNESHGRAYPLNEDGQPLRSEVTPASLAAIINWLAVEKHARYLPGAGSTFCNIYAYDYCNLSGSFLPRVWWTDSALQQLAKGNSVQPLYDKTVHELNANSLHDWLGDHGPNFGWRRVTTVEELQSAANAGNVAIICAKRKDLNRSGHIVAVVPETTTKRALRVNDVVKTPLQSQAGSNNFRYDTPKWWTSSKFSSFGFWVMT